MDDLSEKFTPGSQPVYVSSVQYGALALLFIESTHSEELVKEAISLSMNKFSVDVDVSTEYTAREIFDESSIIA